MTTELLQRLNADQLERAKYAYLELREVYEESCGGVRPAQQYREYWVIVNTIAVLNRVIFDKFGDHGRE